MTNNDRRVLDADRPLTKPDEDALGYAPTARNLASGLLSMAPSEGFVVAVHGPWGSGKSTMLSFVEHYLRADPGDSGAVIVRFNPWWFSGEEAILLRFFDQLQAVLSSKMGKAWRQVHRQIGQLAEALAPMTGSYGPIAHAGGRLLRGTASDVHMLKAKVSGAIARVGRQVFVFVDDVDRLNAAEIKQLFTVIRAVADFYGVVYLIAFDRNVVESALSVNGHTDGASYVDKIVQLPVELPLPDPTRLLEMLANRLLRAFTREIPEGLWDQSRWRRLANNGLVRLIRTSRDAVRLVNTVAVSHAPVEGEVNVVDMIGIEALRLFVPEVYDLVRGSREQFAGELSLVDHADRKAALTAFHDAWLNDLKNAQQREAARDIAMLLFPKLESVFENRLSVMASWHKERRICHPQLFSAYFRLTIPTSTPSRAQMSALVALSLDREALGDKLRQASAEGDGGGMGIDAVLRYLPEYTTNAPQEQIKNTVWALLRVGRDLMQEAGASHSWDWLPMYTVIAHATVYVLRQVEKTERAAALLQAIADADGLAVLVDIVYVLLKEQKEASSLGRAVEGRLLDDSEIEDLKQAVLDKLKECAQTGELLNQQELRLLLEAWNEWGTGHEAVDWVQSQLRSRDGLLAVVRAFTSEASLEGQALLSKLRPFADPYVLLKHVYALSEECPWAEDEKDILRPLLDAVQVERNSQKTSEETPSGGTELEDP